MGQSHEIERSSSSLCFNTKIMY